MKAKFENIVNHDRKQLQDVLPLDTPYSLFIDVCNLCNFKCKFCAIQYTNKTFNFKKQCMDLNLFKKIIDDVAKFDKPLKMLRLAANGEPLINKYLPEMISYAKERGVADFIEFVSNASLLTPELNRKLVKAGLDRIRISIEAIDATEYENIAGVKIDWEKFIKNIRDLYNNKEQCQIYIKTVDASVKTKEQKDIFFNIFGDICDNISIEHVIPIWVGYDEIYNDFAIEQKEGLHGDSIRDVNICPFPFYSCVVNPEGQVTVCCNDWERKILIGDVTKDSLVDIWQGEKYKDFLMGMLRQGRRKNHSACSKCVYPCYDAVDNIDGFSESILYKFAHHEVK